MLTYLTKRFNGEDVDEGLVDEWLNSFNKTRQFGEPSNVHIVGYQYVPNDDMEDLCITVEVSNYQPPKPKDDEVQTL